MNKSELVAKIADHTQVERKAVATVLEGFEHVVTATVHKGEKVAIPGFLSFDKVHRKARTARNPQTGEPIEVAASNAPKVAAGANFKKVIKGEVPPPKLNG